METSFLLDLKGHYDSLAHRNLAGPQQYLIPDRVGFDHNRMAKINRRKYMKIIGTAATLSTAGCLRLQSNDDNAGETETDSISNNLTLTKQWEYPPSGAVKGAEGDFYISKRGDRGRGLVKLNQSGEEIFTNTEIFERDTWLDFWYWNNALHVDETGVYIGVQTDPEDVKGARVHRLDPQTGEVIWEYIEESRYKSIMDPLRHDDQIIYGNSKNNDESSVRAVNVNTGREEWHFSDFDGRITELITSGDDLWIQSTASITRYDLAQNEKQEAITNINPQWSLHSKLENGILYVPSDPLKTFDLDSTEEIWGEEQSLSLHTDPVIMDSIVIYGTTTGYIYVFKKSSGRSLWETRIDGEVGNPMIPHQDNLWVNTNTGYLYAIDIESGEIVYKEQVVSGEETRFSMAIQDDIIAIQERYNSEPMKTGGFELLSQ